MSLESILFKKDFFYNSELVEKFISIIKTSPNPRRVRAFKNLVFKMMKDIVKKNIANYLNLLRNTEIEALPERDELVADCYIIFDKCVDKFIIGSGYNFYFYFNKSLSRNFFRDYQKEIKRNNITIEITDLLTIVNSSFHITEMNESVNFYMNQLQFTEIEMRVCNSKIQGQKTIEFLEQNTDISSAMYSKTLKSIKDKLLDVKDNKDI